MNRHPEDFDGDYDELNDNIESESTSFDLQTLERTILAASNYVIPSDNLRPLTLDKARRLTCAKANSTKIGFAAVFGLSAWGCLALVVGFSSDFHDRLVSPLGIEMQHIAAELSTRNREGMDWALVDAFLNYRTIYSSQSPLITKVP